MLLVGTGRLGADAVIRHTPDGTAVANLSIAWNYGTKGDDGKRKSQWLEAALFGTRAEKLAQYLLKGKEFFFAVEDPHIETYEGKNGTGTKLVGRINIIDFVSSSTEKREEAPKPAKPPVSSGGAFENFEDDIPF